MKTTLKSLAMMAAVLVGIVLIGFFGFLIWMRSSNGLQWVQTRINAAIPGRIHIDSHQLSLIPPQLDLYDAVLYDNQDNPLAGFSHFHVRVGVLVLLKKELRLEAVILETPWADLVMQETGYLNLTSALLPSSKRKETEDSPPEDSGLPFNVVLPSISLTEGRIAFKQENGYMEVEASGITLSADGNLMARSGQIALEIPQVHFTAAGAHPEPARLNLRARLEGNHLSIPSLDVASGKSVLHLTGTVDGLPPTSNVDAVLSVNSQLSDLNKGMALAGDYKGSMEAEINLKGALDNPDATFTLTIEDGQIAGQSVDHGNLLVSLHDRQITIHDMAWRQADGMINLDGKVDFQKVFPSGLFAPQVNVNATSYTLNLVSNLPDLNPWLDAFVDIDGKARVNASLAGYGVTGPDISTQLTLKLSGRELIAPGIDQAVDAEAELAAQMENGQISLSRLDVSAEGTTLNGNGRFDMADRTLSGKLSLAADDLSRIFAIAGIPTVSGSCNGALTVTGSLGQPQFSADLSSTKLKYDSYTFGDVEFHATMDQKGKLELSSLNLRNQNSRIHGNGLFRLLPDGGGIDPKFDNALHLTLENVSAVDFSNSLPINGTLDGLMQLGGPLASLKGTLSLMGQALSMDEATIGDIDTRMRFENGTVLMDRFHLKNRDSTITASGSVTLLTPETVSPVENPTFAFTAQSGHLNPKHFVDFAGGEFTFKGELEGTVDNPAGQITLAGKRLDIAGQPVEDLSLKARIDDRRLWLDRLLVAVVPGEQMEGKGWLGMDKTMDLRLTSDGIAVSHIRQLKDLFPGEGSVSLDVTAQGVLENPDIDGQLTITDIIVNDEPMEDVRLAFNLQDMKARATGNLNFGMDAAYDLKGGDFDAHFLFDRTETAAYFKAAGKPDFHGTLTGRVDMAGNRSRIAQASAKVDLSDVQLLHAEKMILRSDKIVAQLADQTVTIPGFKATLLNTGNLNVKGQAKIDGPIDMQMDGRIPLAAVAALSDELTDAKGFVALEGNISGSKDALAYEARIDLENIGMTIPGLAQKLHDLNGSIQLTPDSLLIEKFSGFLDTGSFTVQGTIGHDKFQPVKFNMGLQARSLPLEIPDTLAVLLNSNIQISGKDRKATAKGEIVLLEGIYYKDVNINLLQVASTATTRQRATPVQAKPIRIPFVDTVRLDIAVQNRQPFEVQNNLADLAISPELRIGGSLANPIVSGRAQVRNGTVTFQRRDFDVTRGVVDFINPYKTEAEIDIESEAEVRTWKINLAIKGTMDNLAFTLTSVPSETEADILSLILFGRTAEEFSSGTGGTQRTTGQIMAEMIAETFGGDIKKNTGIDILELETTDSSGDDDADRVRVTVGKQLSDRMTVKYAVETNSGETLQWAIMEYKLLERILLNGSQSTSGLFGGELVYRVEFR